MAKAKELTVAKTKFGRARASRFPAVFSVVCTLFIATLYLLNAFQWLDFRHSDILFRQRGMRPVDKHISLVAIDDDSIAAIGQYPWPRHVYKDLIEKLMKDGVKVVALDIIFLNPSRPKEDKALIDVTREFGPRIVHAVTVDPAVQNVYEFSYPFPALRKVVKSMGQVTMPIKDADGSIRTMPVFMGHSLARYCWDWLTDKDAMPMLGVEALAVFQGVDPKVYLKKPYLAGGLLLNLNFRGEKVKKVGTQVINGREEEVDVFEHGVPRISAARVLKGDLSDKEKAILKGGLVFVGSTSLGAYDHNPSPFSPQDPSVLVHATEADNLLRDRALRMASPYVTVLLVPLLVGLAFWLGRLNPLTAGLAFAAALAALLLGHYALFLNLYYIEFSAPLTAFVVTFFALVIHKAVEENRKAAEVRGMFGQYVAPEVVDILVKNPDKLSLGGEKRDMTMFFLDIAHFT
ncbi:MAG: CHASE2 domain-containing protein, partial [Elusimicrobia bacterium]|nr:CHASE2 domain-containing protein [Elusimicrobiota bacterium]